MEAKQAFFWNLDENIKKILVFKSDLFEINYSIRFAERLISSLTIEEKLWFQGYFKLAIIRRKRI